MRKPVVETMLGNAILKDAASKTFRVLWPAKRHSTPKVEAFVNFMSKNLFKQNE